MDLGGQITSTEAGEIVHLSVLQTKCFVMRCLPMLRKLRRISSQEFKSAILTMIYRANPSRLAKWVGERTEEVERVGEKCGLPDGC